MKYRFLTISLCASFLLVSFYSTCRAADTPTGKVRSILNEIMAIQTNPKLEGKQNLEKRRLAIKHVIATNFDQNAMAQRALGDYWHKLNSSQRAQFKKVFEDLFQDSYTRLVLNFLKQETIRYNNEKGGHEKATVSTTIMRTNDKIGVNYFLSTVNRNWLVDDVTIDGVSIVGNYQNAFSRVIRTQSFESLLQKMRLQQKAVAESS